MVLKRSMAELRNGLVYSMDRATQLESLNKLGTMDNNPDAIQIIADAMKAPQVAVKPEIMTTLSNIDREEVYLNLAQVIEEGGDTIRWNIYDVICQAELNRKYLEKMDKFRQLPDKYSLLAALIRFMGKLGDQDMMEPIGQMIFTNDDSIRMAVIDALDSFDNHSCLNYLMTAVKLFSPDIAARALAVLTRFKDKNAMLLLIYALGEAGGATVHGIAKVLQSYEPDEVLEIIKSNISKEDRELIHASIMYLEMSNNIEEARRLRADFKIGGDMGKSRGDAAAAATLEFEIKNIGDLVLIGMKGILDLYTLPRLQRVMETIITHGHNKLLLMCEYLTKMDRHSTAYLNRIQGKLKKMMGGLRLVKLECLSDVELKHALLEEDMHDNLPSAASSFSVYRSERVVKVTDAMLAGGSALEVTYTTGGVEKTRTAAVLESDQKRVKLSWKVIDKSDVFQEYANDNIRLIMVRNNEVLATQTRVVEQIHFPDPGIMVLRPRMARVEEQRKEIRIDTRFPIKFLQVKNLKEVSKTQFPGLCLNISAGGVLLLTPIKLGEGSIIILAFPQEKLRVGKVLGKVARRIERIEHGKMLYEYGIIFVKIMDSDRLKIKKFVFDKISVGN